jgi:transcriptional regulator with XRE-family HTH domain
MNNESLKKKIYRLRREKGLSQESIAEKLPMSLNAYAKIERGSTKLISDRLVKIAKLLDTTVEDLLLGPNLTTVEKCNTKCKLLSEQYEQSFTKLRQRLDSSFNVIDNLNILLNEKEKKIKELEKKLSLHLQKTNGTNTKKTHES